MKTTPNLTKTYFLIVDPIKPDHDPYSIVHTCNSRELEAFVEFCKEKKIRIVARAESLSQLLTGAPFR